MTRNRNTTQQRGSLRVLLTMLALCLPVLAAAFLSGNFMNLRNPADLLEAPAAQAAHVGHHMNMSMNMGAPARETETETRTAVPGSTTTPNATVPPGGGVVDVQMQSHDVFSPADITIEVGTTVRWTNADNEDHTTTSDGGVWNSGVLHAGEQFLFTFTQPGVYNYSCLFHAAEGMRGTITVTGQGLPTNTPQPTNTPAGGTVQVNIQNFGFQPGNVTILVGSTVRWTNLDTTQHTATSNDGLWDTGALNQGQSGQFTFTTAGTFAYHCDRHTGMTGTITVINPGQATPTTAPQATATTQPSNTPQPTGTTGPRRMQVNIQNYAYSVLTTTINVGDSVNWTNLDPDPNGHTVTSTSGAFDSGVFLQNQSWSFTFNAPGTYQYYCLVHGTFMTGYVVVQGSGPQPTETAQSEPTHTPMATTTPNACTITFTDVPVGSTFYQYVRCLACRNILGGYPDNTFRPGNLVTRGQLAKIVANAANLSNDPGTVMFEDVPADSPFFVWINRLSRLGIMGGYACGGAGEPCVSGLPYFRPSANATRGQISKIVSNAAGFSNMPSGQTFEDVPADSPFYLWIERLAGRGTMSGYACGGPGEPCMPGSRPYFRPSDNATRGQIAKIVSNTFFPNCGQ